MIKAESVVVNLVKKKKKKLKGDTLTESDIHRRVNQLKVKDQFQTFKAS